MSDREWEKKQHKFLNFLKEHGAEKAPYRVDLEKRKIYWVNEMGLSLVVADCRVILSYALSNNSVMMAWVNSSLKDEATIEPVDGMDDVYPDCEPEDVWRLAVAAATVADAEAIYRTPSPQSWVLLALWNLRPGGAEQFTTGSPRAHVVQVVQSLFEYPDFDERLVLLDNYAESFLQMASHPYKGTEYEARLKDTAREFRNLLVHQDIDQQDAGLLKIRLGWEAD